MKTILRNRRQAPVRSGPRPHERGAVLILALLISVVMAILAVPYMAKLSGRYKTTERAYDSLAAEYLAEAGIERAIWELNYGSISSWGGSSSQRTLTMTNVQASNGAVIGSISIIVNDPGGAAPVIETTGSVVHTGSATINKTIRVSLSQPAGVYNFAIFGSEWAWAHGSAILDSYDSSLGVYGGGNVASHATVGCNTTGGDKKIWIEQTAKVYGDCKCGYQTDPNTMIWVDPTALVTGTKTALSSAKVFAPAIAPTGLTNKGNYKVNDNTTLNLSTSGKYGTLELGNRATLNITGDVTLHVTTKLKTGDAATINVAAGAKLTVVLDHSGGRGGVLEMNNSTIINTASLKPSDLSIVGTSACTGDLNFKSQSNFYGNVYVPSGNLKFENTPQVFGSVIAKQIELKGTTKFHYDEALAGYLPNGASNPTGSPFKMKSWQGK